MGEISPWLRHGSILLLFLFLAASQYLLIEAHLKIRSRRPCMSLAATYRRLWVLTEVAPAATALMILVTGLRLIWEAPAAHSTTTVWVLIMVAGFSVFFFDKIFAYQPIVRD